MAGDANQVVLNRLGNSSICTYGTSFMCDV